MFFSFSNSSLLVVLGCFFLSGKTKPDSDLKLVALEQPLDEIDSCDEAQDEGPDDTELVYVKTNSRMMPDLTRIRLDEYVVTFQVTCVIAGIYYVGICNYGYIAQRLLPNVSVTNTGSDGSTL